jgi:hypothetical protein
MLIDTRTGWGVGKGRRPHSRAARIACIMVRKAMSKSYNNLFPQIATFANLHAAWVSARRGKRRRPDVAAFECNLESNLPIAALIRL